MWGARTLGGDQSAAEIKYINVRRLMIFLRESIDEGTQFAVFEPNSHPLVAAHHPVVDRVPHPACGATARCSATFPRRLSTCICDETTNPPETRGRRDQVVIEIGVAPVNPAEFVIVPDRPVLRDPANVTPPE